MALALGVPGGLDPTSPKAIEAISQILAACKKHKIRAGIHTGSAANAKAMVTKGFDFVTILGDARILSQACQALVNEVRTVTAGAGK